MWQSCLHDWQKQASVLKTLLAKLQVRSAAKGTSIQHIEIVHEIPAV
jgi:hypothetical protein